MKIISIFLLPILAAGIISVEPKSNKDPLENLPLPISQESVDLIVHYEVGGRSYYDKFLQRPTVPAHETTASGITLGFGNDVGHMTNSQIQEAFKDVLTPSQIKALQSVSGLKGRNAYYNGLPKVRNLIRLSYEDAEKVFKNYTLPKFTKQTADAFKLKRDSLHPHSNGALTSLVFNRGPSMSSSSSRKEMRDIRHYLSINQPEKVPNLIRSMKRLWSYTKLKGLHLRRDAEAKLFQKGLDS